MSVSSLVSTTNIAKDKSYPWIGHNKDMVVMFTDPEEGFVIGIINKENSVYGVGEFYRNWLESSFHYFQGEVILKNEDK